MTHLCVWGLVGCLELITVFGGTGFQMVSVILACVNDVYFRRCSKYEKIQTCQVCLKAIV